jgi:Cu(I)/Ag(I) efflux system membrane protein CusA/SilA
MLKRLIAWSVDNKLIVVLFTVAALGAGVLAVRRTPLEALPDLSDVQVIIQTDYSEQAPRIVEDQVTYPIAAEMLKVPGSRVVRGYSYFGVSFVYIIFDDGTDLYWARSRVLEYLNGLKGRLPASVSPTLGPDATGLGWVFQYALEDTTGRLSLADLRSLQDWYLRYQLTAVPGVSEVATVGGFEKQYQVDLDPAKLLAYRIPVTRVMQSIQNANADIGAMVVELSEREYMVRGLGYLKSLSDIENVVVEATAAGTPIRVAELGRVSVGPAVRRGVVELDGRGDAVGAIVIMRFGQNALTTAEHPTGRRGPPRVRPERPDRAGDRDAAREAARGEPGGRARLHRVPLACALGDRGDSHAARGHPDGVRGDATGWRRCRHHVVGRDRDRHRRDD